MFRKSLAKLYIYTFQLLLYLDSENCLRQNNLFRSKLFSTTNYLGQVEKEIEKKYVRNHKKILPVLYKFKQQQLFYSSTIISDIEYKQKKKVIIILSQRMFMVIIALRIKRLKFVRLNSFSAKKSMYGKIS